MRIYKIKLTSSKNNKEHHINVLMKLLKNTKNNFELNYFLI